MKAGDIIAAARDVLEAHISAAPGGRPALIAGQIAEKLLYAQGMVDYDAKIKRAKNARKRWARKTAYYTKAFAKRSR